MDASSAIRVRTELPNTKVLAITEESVGDGLGISHSTSPPYSAELALHSEARVGPSWSRCRSQHLVVADCDWSASLHFHHKI